jgi:quercetin dioxygenase-like cupin family protein
MVTTSYRRSAELDAGYRFALAAIAFAVAAFISCTSASAQICRPVSERTGEVGCWIIAQEPVGRLPAAPTFWHLDAYPNRALAEAARGPGGTVVESLGKTWLLTIASEDWRPSGSERVAKIGPLPVAAGTEYSAQYMEAIFNPGMTAPAHVHSGPEAWYTLAGETCLETPQGAQIGRAGSDFVIVPGGPPMHLTATGTVQRRALVLILHDSSKPATTPVHDWAPKGLCKT